MAHVITVKYSCPLCGLDKVECVVPGREETQDVRDWVGATIREVSRDHQAHSPACHPKRLHDLMIPVNGADYIGGPTT